MLKDLPKLSVAVLGAGPRALASAICLSRHHSVSLGEIVAHRSRQQLVRQPIYPGESMLDELLLRNPTPIRFTDSYASALIAADLVIVAEQPVFRSAELRFDMSAIERCMEAVARLTPRATVILEATTPVGYANRVGLRHGIQVIPSPLLLRQGHVARDRAQPQRFVVGSTSESGRIYAFNAVRSCRDPNTPYLLTNASEAEAIHAFERWRVLRGRSETSTELMDYCKRHRLDVDQMHHGLQPLDHVHESPMCSVTRNQAALVCLTP